MSSLIVEVCKVDNIIKHPNADKLSVVSVKGWTCIVGLDQYKVGDLVVFCPPDSIIPLNLIEKYNLEFLKKNGRVGTIKLRGVISQGLVLDCLCIPGYEKETDWEGQNVAEILGIKKYEPPVDHSTGNCIRGKATRKKPNPYFDKYTEIENIKNFPGVFKEGEEIVITEKIHGSNARYGILKRYKKSLWGKIKSILFGEYEFLYGSHNVQLTHRKAKQGFYKEDIYYKAIEKYDLENRLPKNYIFYGEVYGKGVQELTYGLEDIHILFFDVKDMVTGKYLDYFEFLIKCEELGLSVVPPLYCGLYSTEMIKNMTVGKSVLYKDQIREGCVIKSLVEENHPLIGRKILKSINEEYLLRQGGTEGH